MLDLCLCFLFSHNIFKYNFFIYFFLHFIPSLCSVLYIMISVSWLFKRVSIFYNTENFNFFCSVSSTFVVFYELKNLVQTLVDAATWCICKDASDAILQKTLDYACGAGADCNPLHTNGPCFQPNTVRAHCSYAVNSFFQKKGQGQGTCDFAGTATAITSNPSINLQSLFSFFCFYMFHEQ